jgi:deazaflavin-dependent oxidoreductase (nitroreductase family)
MSGNLPDALTSLGARALKTRWFVRLPIWIYRAGLGFVFGSRLLMLEHIGRKSAARRFVVLEVVEHTTRDEYVVVSGFGERAQWYRNVVADPRVWVSCGFRRNMAGSALPMTEEQAAASLQHYADRHPKAWANLRATIETAVGHPVAQLPMVTLRLQRVTR